MGSAQSDNGGNAGHVYPGQAAARMQQQQMAGARVAGGHNAAQRPAAGGYPGAAYHAAYHPPAPAPYLASNPPVMVYGGAPGPMGRPLPYGYPHNPLYAQPYIAPSAPIQQQTVKLKNDVNLKKNTLNLQRDATGKYGISFDFDTVIPCAIRVLFFTTELVDKNNCTISFEQNVYDKGSKAYTFPAGNNQHFELPAEENLDLSKFAHHQLTYSPNTHFYPLIIALGEADEETKKANLAPSAPPPYEESSSVPPSATATSLGPPPPYAPDAFPSASSMTAPKAEQETHIKSQITFAFFARKPDGDFEVRVIKQKIQVDGFAYELQEIYGLEKEKDSGQECVVCLTNPSNLSSILPLLCFV